MGKLIPFTRSLKPCNDICKESKYIDFYMMVGIPCSGKTTQAKQLQTKVNAHIVSSDEIRYSVLNKHRYDQQDNEVVFYEVGKRIESHLKNGENIILDATNIYIKYRKPYIEMAKRYNCNVIAIVCKTSLERCLRRNENRIKKIPEEHIIRMSKSIQWPSKEEGVDEIIYV